MGGRRDGCGVVGQGRLKLSDDFNKTNYRKYNYMINFATV